VLAFPFGREIPQARHANAPRQPSIDCGLDQRRCEEGKRDRSVDLSDTAGLPLRNLFNIRDCSSDQLFKPTSSQEQGIFPVKSEIITAKVFWYTQRAVRQRRARRRTLGAIDLSLPKWGLASHLSNGQIIGLPPPALSLNER
jgi:hypothetical protein